MRRSASGSSGRRRHSRATARTLNEHYVHCLCARAPPFLCVQCERAADLEAEEARIRQKSAIGTAAAARSVDRVRAAVARRQALEVRRGDIQQQRHEAEATELRSLTDERLERVRRGELAVKTLRRKLSFERKGDTQRKGVN